MTTTPQVIAALSVNALFSAVSDLSCLPVEIVAPDRDDLTLAHAELGRLIERLPVEQPDQGSMYELVREAAE
jgi:hypothetical protein